jgi:hypothetical protein
VSNLSFLSKTLERIVLKSLQMHLARIGLEDILQSAYKALHSTETALLKIQSDISTHLDNSRSVMFVLLDLSSAFDTIDHSTLLNLLQFQYAIVGTALDWFRSYLTLRTQSICIFGDQSEPVLLKYGVPQGSVLGPVLFSLYIQPVTHIIKSFGLSYHCYADDTQLYFAYDPADSVSVSDAINRIQRYVVSIKCWVSRHNLKLNNTKTEFVNFMSPHHLKMFGRLSLLIDGAPIQPSSCVKSLGVLFDQHMTMSDNVSSVVRTGNFHLRNIGRVRQFLTDDACMTAIQSLVVSRFDYCSSLLSVDCRNFKIVLHLFLAGHHSLPISPLYLPNYIGYLSTCGLNLDS